MKGAARAPVRGSACHLEREEGGLGADRLRTIGMPIHHTCMSLCFVCEPHVLRGGALLVDNVLAGSESKICGTPRARGVSSCEITIRCVGKRRTHFIIVESDATMPGKSPSSALDGSRSTTGPSVCDVVPDVCSGNYTGSQLSLPNMRLKGYIPTQILLLTQLKLLELNENDLSGTIPPLGALGSLQALDLTSNGFISGTLPATLAPMLALRSLRLTHNLLSGSLHSA